jgi:hypothetical protein
MQRKDSQWPAVTHSTARFRGATRQVVSVNRDTGKTNEVHRAFPNISKADQTLKHLIKLVHLVCIVKDVFST